MLSDPKLLKLFVGPVWEVMEPDLGVRNQDLAIHQVDNTLIDR